jgi:hypothetical protein
MQSRGEFPDNVITKQGRLHNHALTPDNSGVTGAISMGHMSVLSERTASGNYLLYFYRELTNLKFGGNKRPNAQKLLRYAHILLTCFFDTK